MKEYIIKDVVQYATDMRHFCVDHLRDNAGYDQNPNENLDEYITVNEIISLVTKRSNSLNNSNQLVITEEINENIFDDICDWVYGIGLSKLASKNLVECAWDDEQNCMVFWKPEISNHERSAD